MIHYLHSLLVFLIVSVSLSSVSGQDWELMKQDDGIDVYYRDATDSPIKELKINLTVDASLSTIMAVLYDIENYKEWVYSCEESRLVKRLNETEIYYYNEIDFPWPLSNRDMIAHSNIEQDPHTKVVRTQSLSAHYMEPEKDGLVRMTVLQINWIITPIGPKETEIEYYLKSDPAGNIPAWVINFAIDHGPTKTMKAFREQLKLEEYRNQKVSFIIE
jgi:ribosome-associated toxin RatA of RatAB toxin-antitoxin module